MLLFKLEEFYFIMEDKVALEHIFFGLEFWYNYLENSRKYLVFIHSCDNPFHENSLSGGIQNDDFDFPNYPGNHDLSSTPELNQYATNIEIRKLVWFVYKTESHLKKIQFWGFFGGGFHY